MPEPAEEPASERLPPDTVLEGRYRIDGALGDGGIGWVYRGWDLERDVPVAIKTLQPQYAHHPQMRPRFEREAKALASLDHPHIVKLSDFSVADGRPYLVMELLQGQTLEERIEEETLPDSVVRHIALQTIDALAYAHEAGCVHRDLKPANIFLSETPTNAQHVKILDFGFVKLVEGDDEAKPQTVLTRSGIAFGTPGYMSPEQAVGGEMDARTDLYSFTVLLFHMLAGRRPFVGSLPEVVRQHLTEAVPNLGVGGRPIRATPELKALLEKGMAKDVGARFESAAAMRDALLALPSPWTRPAVAGDAPTEPALELSTPEPTIPATPAARSRGSSQTSAPRVYVTPPSGEPPQEPAVPDARPVAPTREGGRFGAIVTGVALAVCLVAGGLWAFVVLPRADGAPEAFVTDEVGAEPLAEPDPERADPDPVDTQPADMEIAPVEAGPMSLADEVAGDWTVWEALDEADDDEADDDEADDDEAPPEAGAPVDPEDAQDAEATAAAEAEAENEPLGPNPWRVRPLTPELVRTRREVLAGRALSHDDDRALRALARADRSDPRPHLLLAQSFVADGHETSAIERYDLAQRVDDTARGDPRMLDDLVRLASTGAEQARATAMLARVYPEEGVERVRDLLEDEDLPADRRAALEALRTRLESDGEVAAPAPSASARARAAARARRRARARQARALRARRVAASRRSRRSARSRRGRRRRR
ncbi:MAG: protein kinase [Sandaracinaceae bacterium]|nr:protein kinase [Sandaracinaceae bacterium]